jgi:hypothetical protein
MRTRHDKLTLAKAFPDLVQELEESLSMRGEQDLLKQIREVFVFGVTCDGKIGYIATAEELDGPGKTMHLAETQFSLVLDVASDGSLIGIEVLAPSAPLKSKLRDWAARSRS